jgi:hypothetical protein
MPFFVSRNFVYAVEGGKVRGETVYVDVDSILLLLSITRVLQCRVQCVHPKRITQTSRISVAYGQPVAQDLCPHLHRSAVTG